MDKMIRPILQVTGVCKRFGALDILRSVDLTVGAGRVVAIVGPNGAGKTTLIKSVLGLTRPDSGRITLSGTDVLGANAYRAAIGYMPQIARFPENLTGAELIALLKDLRGPTAQLDTELIDCFGLEEALEKPL